MKHERKSFRSDFRMFFLRGLATLLPTVLTIVVLFKCFEFVQQNISVHLVGGASRIMVLATRNLDKWKDYPKLKQEEIALYITEKKIGKLDLEDAKVKDDMRAWKLSHQWSSGPRSLVGFILAIILVYIVGRLLGSYFGRKIWQFFEKNVSQVPGFKQVYPYVKQITDYIFGEERIEFSRVVAVPYPRQGIWSVGLVTGAGFRHVGQATKEEYLTIFIPSSPTPVTGYVIHVKKDEVIDLPISIEEALRFTVSGGVIVPEHQALPTQRIELRPGPAGRSEPPNSRRKEKKDQ